MPPAAHGVPTILDIDLNSGQLLNKVLGLADYAIFSAPAFRLFVKGGSDEDRLSRLVQSSIRHAGVTMGSEGYLWAARGGISGRQAAFPRRRRRHHRSRRRFSWRVRLGNFPRPYG